MHFGSAEEIASAKVVRFPALGYGDRNFKGEIFAMVKACSIQEAKDKYKLDGFVEPILHPEQVGILYRWVNKSTGNVCVSWLNEYDSRLEMWPADKMDFVAALQALREGYVVARGGNRLHTYWCNMDGNLIIHQDVERGIAGDFMNEIAQFSTEDVLAKDWAIVDTVLNDKDYPSLSYVRRDPTNGKRIPIDAKELDAAHGVPFKLLKIKQQRAKAAASAQPSSEPPKSN